MSRAKTYDMLKITPNATCPDCSNPIKTKSVPYGEGVMAIYCCRVDGVWWDVDTD